MTKRVELNKFKEMLEAEEAKKADLVKLIEDEKQQAADKEIAYKQALSADDDKKADSLQKDIEGLERSIKRNEDKLSLTNDKRLSDDALMLQADEVLNESVEALDKLTANVKKLEAEFYEIKQEMIAKAKEIKSADVGSEYRQAVAFVSKQLPEWVEQQNQSLVYYDKAAQSNKFNKEVRKPMLRGLSDNVLWRL